MSYNSTAGTRPAVIVLWLINLPYLRQAGLRQAGR